MRNSSNAAPTRTASAAAAQPPAKTRVTLTRRSRVRVVAIGVWTTSSAGYTMYSGAFGDAAHSRAEGRLEARRARRRRQLAARHRRLRRRFEREAPARGADR